MKARIAGWSKAYMRMRMKHAFSCECRCPCISVFPPPATLQITWCFRNRMAVPSGRMRQNWCSLSWSIEVGTLIPEQCAKCGAAILVYIADIFTSLQFIGLPTWFLLHDEWISASHWYGSWNRLFYCVWICWTMLGGLTTAHLESYFFNEASRLSEKVVPQIKWMFHFGE